MVHLVNDAQRPSHKHLSALIAKGYSRVAGVDEVGRGSLAGPVTAAAVILEPGCRIRGVRDSKALSSARRRQLSETIKARALSVGVGWSSHEEIDQHGLSWAIRHAGWRALKDLSIDCDAVLLDGKHNYLADYCYCQTVVSGDRLCESIACASIIAKVARDAYMHQMHDLYPDYGWATNAGYATHQHLAAIDSKLSPLHRRCFRPIAARWQMTMTGL